MRLHHLAEPDMRDGGAQVTMVHPNEAVSGGAPSVKGKEILDERLETVAQVPKTMNKAKRIAEQKPIGYSWRPSKLGIFKLIVDA